ncbi:aminodeoxychorismate synthase component I [Methylobacterium frigidaeris]|uniref:aminodeoxychorismate synthase n=1 Tax=Methylobacterium frigidaeris TaxID=2038277 RepID=A0AA37HEE2_9HYPH|nr:aminodeoxychorismate synthase component I [Methylobacterium frigidaeris]PIK70109.1 aminodeoxychorismate synthase, component I [Methylobacterium frigidaeris]GJD64229.1 Aminodeoxychorismate synthase component 1 [Methylobacterium frigidaeris]
MWCRSVPSLDPAAAAARLRGKRPGQKSGLALLDSAMRHDTLGRHSYLAADPFGSFRVRGGQALWNGAPVSGAPLDALRTVLAPYRTEPAPGLPPFQGGAIGYVAYDFGANLERVAPPARRAGLSHDLAFDLYATIVAFDHRAGTCHLIATGFPETDGSARTRKAASDLDALEATLAGPEPTTEAAPVRSLAWHSNFTAETYARAVEQVRDYIRAGDIYQANIAQRFEAALPPGFDAFAFYRRLRARNPAPFAAYLELDGLTVASSSPERFLRLDGRQVETRPIKGTAPRSADPAEDRARAEALVANAKERAENVMIVDLLRNDLSRICAPHSVAVPTLCGLETYAGVHHLVSAVAGTLREGADGLDLLAATFPGGSITGAPKLRAMDIITEIEGDARELYCGAIGWIGFDGSLDTSIAIRTVLMDGSCAVLQAGGGVTLLSDPEAEYRETLTKAERVFSAFANGEGA